MTLLLVDDHPVVLEGMKTLLSSLSNIMFVSATSAARAKDIIAGSKVDIMVTDLELPDGYGTELVAYLHGRQPYAKVAIYTMHEEAFSTATPMPS